MRKSERGATLLESGGLTRRSIGRTACSPNPEDVVSTTDQVIGLDKAGALNKFMNPGSLEGPRRKVAATIYIYIYISILYIIYILYII